MKPEREAFIDSILMIAGITLVVLLLVAFFLKVLFV